MKRDFAYIVLGLGGIGSGALYWLARQAGGEVLGLEQFAIGHVRGGSQDHSRIIRLSYHTPGYVELAKAAYRAWTAVETDLGEPLIVKTGGQVAAPCQLGGHIFGDISMNVQMIGFDHQYHRHMRRSFKVPQLKTG